MSLAVCFILFWINILIGLKKKAAVQKQEDVKFTVTDILQKVNTLIQFISFMSEKTFARTEFRPRDTPCIYILNRMLGVMPRTGRRGTGFKLKNYNLWLGFGKKLDLNTHLQCWPNFVTYIFVSATTLTEEVYGKHFVIQTLQALYSEFEVNVLVWPYHRHIITIICLWAIYLSV